MTSKRFLVAFFIGFAIFAALVTTFNFYMDLYALFRPASGRLISLYGEERIVKYLHSFRYIPENFDGVLLGSSASDYLDTNAFSGHRIYNASINGGNVEDIRPISEKVLRSNKLRLVIICIHRYITRDHVQKTNFMSPRQYWGALGSPQLFTAYVSRIAIQLGLTQAPHRDWGSLRFRNEADTQKTERIIQEAVLSIKNGSKELENYDIDPIAHERLNRILANARHGGRRVVVYFTPVPAPILELKSAELARYRSRIQTMLKPSDIVVDFNAPLYSSFRLDIRNFADYSHLSQRGAAFIVAELSRVVAEAESTVQAPAK